MKYKQLLIISFGSILEWYDLSLYGILIKQLSSTFYPLLTNESSTHIVYLFFAISLIFRPIGGLIFGYIGDTRGYAYSINLSIFLVGLTSIITGIIPSYSTIGYWGLILLISCRVLQSSFSGSQLAGLITYASSNNEINSKKHQNFFTCLVYSSSAVGALLAAIVAALVVKLFGTSSLSWRIPFLLTLPIVIIYYNLIKPHINLYKSHEYSTISFKSSLIKIFKNEYFKIITLGLLIACSGSLYYILFFYLIHYMEVILHFSEFYVSIINCSSLFLSIIAYIIGGYIADKIANKFTLTFFFLVIFIFCIISMFNKQNHAFLFCIWLMLAVICYSCCVSSFLLVFTKSFHYSIRMSACSAVINLGGIICGTSPLIANLLVSHNAQYLMYYIIIICILIMLLLFMVQLKNKEYSYY